MTVLNLSFLASILILVIVVIRALAINRLSKKTFLVLWGIALARLFIPLSIQSHLSLYNTISNISETSVETQNIGRQIIDNSIQINATASASHETTEVFVSSLTLPLLSIIWLTGMIIMASFFLINHFRGLRKYKSSLPVKSFYIEKWRNEHRLRRTIEIRQSDRIASPLIYGVLRPVILIPKAMDYNDKHKLEYVLTHEYVHIKQFDILKKWLLAIALCIHWFNPLLWVMYILANRDIELSCDDTVIGILGEAAKPGYALTLIGMAQTRNKLTPLCNSFSRNVLEERITAIVKKKRTTVINIVLSVLLVVGVSTAFATSPVETEAPNILRKVFGDDIHRFDKNINKVMDEAAMVAADDFTLHIDSTLFTDNRMHAVIGVAGRVPDDISIKGRIVFFDYGRDLLLPLEGNMTKLDFEDGIQYFHYTSILKNEGTPKRSDEYKLLGYNSFWVFENDRFEIIVNMDANEYVLSTTVEKVLTEPIIIYPDAELHDGDFYNTIVLTSQELKMRGYSENIDENHDWLTGPYVRLTILHSDGKEINLSYDSRGVVYDESYLVGMSRGTGSDGLFYHNWNFREWELDLSSVTTLIINGIKYYI